MRLVCISDTHSLHDRIPGGVPDGDVLVHAGDACGQSTPRDLMRFARWFAKHPHAHKILIAGNHDAPFVYFPHEARLQIAAVGVTYLEDSGVEIDGVRFWGSPWQPEFCNWWFNLPRGPALAEKWAKIPGDTDVLITHGPPHGILDACPTSQGCQDLLSAVRRVAPSVHVFGHIHEGSGVVEIGPTRFVNASVLDGRYRPVNPARVVDL